MNVVTRSHSRERDGIASLIESALDFLGELAERGLEQPHGGSADNVDGIAQRASDLGLTDSAEAFRFLARALRDGVVEQSCDAWLRVATRLLVASESL